MSDFYRTTMGRRFYSETTPKIADQLERLAGAIEALVEELKRQRGANPESTTTHGSSDDCPEVRSGKWTRCRGHPGG